jgi:hypothetical protein
VRRCWCPSIRIGSTLGIRLFQRQDRAQIGRAAEIHDRLPAKVDFTKLTTASSSRWNRLSDPHRSVGSLSVRPSPVSNTTAADGAAADGWNTGRGCKLAGGAYVRALTSAAWAPPRERASTCEMPAKADGPSIQLFFDAFADLGKVEIWCRQGANAHPAPVHKAKPGPGRRPSQSGALL